MLAPPLSRPPIVEDWLVRHNRPVNFALHVLGIPLTLIGVLLVPVYTFTLSLPIFTCSVLAFIAGYLVQFLGHALEGTEPGEVTYLRKKITRSLRKRLRKAVVAATPPTQKPGPVA